MVAHGFNAAQRQWLIAGMVKKGARPMRPNGGPHFPYPVDAGGSKMPLPALPLGASVAGIAPSWPGDRDGTFDLSPLGRLRRHRRNPLLAREVG